MYGAAPYGAFPYGSSGDVEVPDYEAMLSGADDLVLTVRLALWDIAGDVEEVRYYATTAWATTPAEVPASQPFDDRLMSYTFDRSIINDRIGGFAKGQGQIVLANPDGAFDDIGTDYAADGREIEMRVGRIGDPWAQHLPVLKGRVIDAFGGDSLTIQVADHSFVLEVAAQQHTYTGGGAAEGGFDLRGKRKPLLYGLGYGIPATAVNEALLIYQVHDGAISSFLAVYDRGLELTLGASHADYAALAAATVSAGTYDRCLSLGLFRLGATPDGIVFASATVAAAQIPDVIRTVAQDAGLTDGDFDEASFDAFSVVHLGDVSDGGPLGAIECGKFVGSDDSATADEVIGDILDGFGSWASFNRGGKLSIGNFQAPAGEALMAFDRDAGDILNLDLEPMPTEVWPPPWRWRVAHGVNYTVFTDFADTVDDETRAFFAEPYRVYVAEDASILTAHPLAKDPPPVEASFPRLDYSIPIPSVSGVRAEAERLLALYSSGYRLYRLTVDRRGLLLEIGSLIHVTYPRFGLDAGKLMRVCAIFDKVDLTDGGGVDQVEIVAFG